LRRPIQIVSTNFDDFYRPMLSSSAGIAIPRVCLSVCGTDTSK